ncbi:CRAL-TRIO domain-containing protein [Podosphaera aphanis]|nr:CRAL-TRIO domain-containing protein [Podosphaera aphanis]
MLINRIPSSRCIASRLQNTSSYSSRLNTAGNQSGHSIFAASKLPINTTRCGSTTTVTIPIINVPRNSNLNRARHPFFQAQFSRGRSSIARQTDTPVLRFISRARRPSKFLYQSSVSSWSLIAIFSIILLSTFGTTTFLTYDTIFWQTPSNQKAAGTYIGEFCEMDGEIVTGYSGSLTPEQEEKLKELWTATFQVFQVIDDSAPNGSGDVKTKSDPASAKKPKKKRVSIFRRGKEEEAVATGEDEVDDKFGQRKVFNEALANMSPESLRTTLWSMIKADEPDALLLRFLRARQWNVEKALIMMISTMRWRLTEAHIDDDVIKNGELYALNESSESDPARRKFGKEFLDHFRKGKSYVHGIDKKGRPLVYVRVRQHKIGEMSEESLERFTVYVIETARMILVPPIETASVVFDMTGFSMANMDYAPVKFMIKVFEANYPECLGVVLVHKAPWLFQGIWKIIRGWLDPVVASKVHFTNNTEEMEAFVDRTQILKDLGGDDDWTYEYIEPVPGENDLMKDTEAKEKLLQERQNVVKDFENTTLEWIHAGSTESTAINQKRQEIAKSMKESYWRLDPYIRARTYYDRIGLLNPGGIINLQPSKNGVSTDV